MWRYMNATEPGKKLKASEREKSKEYEAKRRRMYRESWENRFKWLFYKDEKMYCRTCVTIDPSSKGPFTEGSTNFKVESLIAHSKAVTHNQNVSKLVAKESLPGSSQAEKNITALNNVNFERVCKLFITAHGLAKQGRPYSDFSFICQLDEKKGLNIGSTYRNDKSACQFIYYIAETERSRLKKQAGEANFLSIMCDGATDSFHLEAEVLFCRFCVKGKLETHFVGIRNIGKADAEGITKSLVGVLDEVLGTSWREKIVGISTDGAAVMLGKNAGVVKKIKDLTDRKIQAVHCSAHRLELAFKAAVKDLGLWKKAEALLMGLYLFYRNSPLNRSNLLQSFDIFDDVRALLPTRVGGTRWLGHTLRALRNLLDGYPAVVEHLRQIQHPSDKAHRGDSAQKAKNFLNALSRKDLLYFLFFLWDVVSCLSDVSAAFQRKEVTLADLHTEVEVAQRVLASYKDSDGPKLQIIFGKESYKGTELIGNANSFQSQRKKLLEELADKLTNRFEVDSAIAEASLITNLSMWPNELSLDEDFGNEHIKRFVSSFRQALDSADVDTESIDTEWRKLKQFIYISFHSALQEGTLDWLQINKVLKDKCPHVLALVDLVLSIPASSVDAERGFSLMKRVKTDWRSRLGDLHLSDLMTVVLESADIPSFNPAPAVHMWTSRAVRSRRPEFMEETQSVTTNSTEDDHEELRAIEERAHSLLCAALSIAKNIAADGDKTPEI